MNCIISRPPLSLSRVIFDWYYQGKALSYAVCHGENTIVFHGREQNDTRTFCLGLGGTENDACYSKELERPFLQTAFQCFLEELKKRRYKELKWECLKYDSYFHELLIDAGADITGSRPITRIRFDCENYNLWLKTLSKHVRQNVRTAYNRLLREGHTMDYTFFSDEFGEHMPHICSPRRGGRIMRQCFSIFMKRHAEKYNIFGVRHKLAQFVKWATYPQGNAFLAVIHVDRRPVAFMAGHKSHVSEIWATRLAIDSTFSFYSPGMILINETIKWLLEKTPIRSLNLGRGTEKYKKDMGGVECIATDYLLRL